MHINYAIIADYAAELKDINIVINEPMLLIVIMVFVINHT